MGTSKDEQTARRRAMQDVIAENRTLFARRMQHHYDDMGLGTWTPRPTPEARAAMKALAVKEKAAKKIQAEAEKAGLTVNIANLGVEMEDPYFASQAAEGERIDRLAEDEVPGDDEIQDAIENVAMAEQPN